MSDFSGEKAMKNPQITEKIITKPKMPIIALTESLTAFTKGAWSDGITAVRPLTSYFLFLTRIPVRKAESICITHRNHPIRLSENKTVPTVPVRKRGPQLLQ